MSNVEVERGQFGSSLLIPKMRVFLSYLSRGSGRVFKIGKKNVYTRRDPSDQKFEIV